ncbi:hypothetical protein FTO70_04340 [Methanosarcina sp. KYL-1]|uniref:hypothetical protein n=1 Tax=Methanosarcina sp. KYL-1 TaxID=2602068 RepID=UPI0021011030|nr:hypothetical protein [Methanosarcina sp. KYL-1]MCQ1534930.1 hypothetical protein [Methanosarcina sp. KYL-1]
MNTKSVKSIARFAVVLMVLSIIPSGAFAADDGTSADDTAAADGTNNMRFEKMMRGMGPGADGGRGMPGMGPAGISGKGMIGTVALEYADEDYFPEIQAAMLECLGQQIERMNDQPEMPEEKELPEGVDEEAAEARAEARAEAQAERLAELNALYDEIEGAGNLDDLKAIAFSHAKEGMSDAIDREIGRFETMTENLDSIENENITKELLAETIEDLQALQEQVDSAEDSEALMSIGEALRGINDAFREAAGIEQGEGLMGSCPMDKPDSCSMRVQGRMSRA